MKTTVTNDIDMRAAADGAQDAANSEAQGTANGEAQSMAADGAQDAAIGAPQDAATNATAQGEAIDAAAQSMREHNIQEIVRYYESGIKPAASALGIELEHTIVHEGSLRPVSYSEEHGVRWLLEQLAANYPTTTLADDGDLIGVSREGEAITIEPAAQVELSAGPFNDLNQALACFMAFEEQLDALLKPHGLTALTCGYHPVSCAGELELIPKRRYEFMNRYFATIGPSGMHMMRGTASTQVSIDYTSGEDCLRKLRAAYALVPLLSLLSDNSPIFEGESRPHKLMRTEVWRGCDPDRCGTVPGIMDKAFTLRDMAEYVLDTPAILIPNEAGSVNYTERSFGELFASKPMNRADVEHAVSMLFNDVRLKTYVEIRPADSMPVPYAIAYAALIKGLFANEETLSQVETVFSLVNEANIEAAKDALMAHGYDAIVYGWPAGDLMDIVLRIARGGLSDSEAELLEPLAELIEARRTLADLQESTAEAATDTTGMMVTDTYAGFYDAGFHFIDQETPISFPCVDGWMPPAFIDTVRTMRVGETQTVHVAASEAYEEYTPERVYKIEREKLPEGLKLPIGEMINLEAPDGQTYPARVLEVNDEYALFDTNHEAICKALNFRITLLDVIDMSRR